MNKPQTLTPGEIVQKYPVLQKINWTPEMLGWFLKAGIVTGTVNNSKNIRLIDEHSVISLVKYRNTILDQQKINF